VCLQQPQMIHLRAAWALFEQLGAAGSGSAQNESDK
jgi:hypothetical protein